MACQLLSSQEPQSLDSSILVQDWHGFSKAEPLFGTWSKNGWTKKSCKWPKNQFGIIKFFGVFFVKKRHNLMFPRITYDIVFSTKKMVPECKPEWNREAIMVFSRLAILMAADNSCSKLQPSLFAIVLTVGAASCLTYQNSRLYHLYKSNIPFWRL